MPYAGIICRLSILFFPFFAAFLFVYLVFPRLFVCLNRLMFCDERPRTNEALMMQFNRNFLLPKAKISHHNFSRRFSVLAIALLLFSLFAVIETVE